MTAFLCQTVTVGCSGYEERVEILSSRTTVVFFVLVLIKRHIYFESLSPPEVDNIVSAVKRRPTGVTILAALFFINGISMLLMPTIFSEMVDIGIFPDMTMVYWGVFGLLALVYFGIGYGLYAGKSWARMVAIILAVIGLLGFPIGTIISIIILIYLFKDDVKAYFK